MFQIIIKIFRPIKIKAKGFVISYHNHIFHYYNELIKLLQPFLVIVLCRYERYSICLISFFNLYELFTAFICDNNIVSLVNCLFGVKIFIPFPSFTSSAPYSGGISNKSRNTSLSLHTSSRCDHIL